MSVNYISVMQYLLYVLLCTYMRPHVARILSTGSPIQHYSVSVDICVYTV